jgi:8-oxo-dGTP pyrophosphatase MutT (NUDIX family)
MKLNYRKGVFLVVYSEKNRENIYLILKRKLHWKGWEFPKGGIEKNEQIKKAIIREIKEETGLKPIKIKKFSGKGKYKYNRKYSDRKEFIGQTYSLYAIEVKFGKARIDRKEHSDYKWLGFNDAHKKLTWTNQKKCLKIVNDWLNK